MDSRNSLVKIIVPKFSMLFNERNKQTDNKDGRVTRQKMTMLQNSKSENTNGFFKQSLSPTLYDNRREIPEKTITKM